MSISNFGTGFSGFKAAIEMITEDLGGAHVRKAVAEIIVGSLNHRVQVRQGERYAHRSHYDVHWTEAMDQEFDDTVAQVTGTIMRLREEEPALFEAAYKGATLRLRGEAVWLEGRGYALLVGTAGNHPQYDNRARAVIDKWSVGITREGAEVLKDANGYRLEGQTSISNSRSLEAAQKSLLRLIAKHAKIEFTPLKDAIAA